MRMQAGSRAVLVALGLVFGTAAASAQVMTAENAVKIALERSTRAVGAEASIIDAKAGMYDAYSRMLPQLRASWSRSGTWLDHSSGNTSVGGVVTPSSDINNFEEYTTVPQLTGTWQVLNLSAIKNRSAASANMKSANLSKASERSEIALAVRRQFYQVVQAIQIAQVNTEALKLARDNERRVRALFDVGSVSRSDLLRAQVQTAQSELDSLTSLQAITVQRNVLAQQIGIREAELGTIDTVLALAVQDYDEAALLTEAQNNRPDIKAAEYELRAANSSVGSAKFRRLPYVTLSGAAQFNTTDNQKFENPDPLSTSNKSDQVLRGALAVNWDFFDGLATDAGIAAARARQMRAKDAHDALVRNLEGDLHGTLLIYREAIARDVAAGRALESAEETVKLNQQKYNVGSATILDLIDAQVQLQRAKSDKVAALAQIRVAEAAVERVRGRAE